MIDPRGDLDILKYVQQKAPVLKLVFNRHGEVTDANVTALGLLGQELLGLRYSDLFINIEKNETLQDIAESAGSSFRMLDIMMPFGLPQTFYFAFSRLGDGYLALGGLDLTEQDAMRNQIITLNNELGNASRALQKANAELRQISELRNQFLAISAHDLRKPLAMIMYASRFLSREAEDRLEPDEMQLLEKIQEASTFMARLVDDFLDVSLAQAGQFVVSCKPTEIGPIISASCDIARTAAQREDVKLEVVVEDALPVLKVDAQRIQQALCNLVGNAFEHARPDTMVTVSARLMGSAVRVSVRDEGEGIPPEVRPRLFQSFERHGVYKSGGKRSVGLGLMIARRIVEAHRGRIWYETEEGVGSTFGFDLPLEDS